MSARPLRIAVDESMADSSREVRPLHRHVEALTERGTSSVEALVTAINHVNLRIIQIGKLPKIMLLTIKRTKKTSTEKDKQKQNG